jgi:hypothetical protein
MSEQIVVARGEKENLPANLKQQAQQSSTAGRFNWLQMSARVLSLSPSQSKSTHTQSDVIGVKRWLNAGKMIHHRVDMCT